MKRVLLLCTGNSARSQMAEAIWRDLGRREWQVFSAGSDPTGFVHPLAIEAMDETGLDIRGAESKHVQQFVSEDFDLVVTVCDNAREHCPAFPGAKDVAHWPFDDPARAEGTDEERLAVFRRVRDEIRERIRNHLQAWSGPR